MTTTIEFRRGQWPKSVPCVSFKHEYAARIVSFTNDFTIWEAMWDPEREEADIWFDDRDNESQEEYDNECASIEEYVNRLVTFGA